MFNKQDNIRKNERIRGMRKIKPEYFVAICSRLIDKPESTQRELAATEGISLGLVNSILKECLSAGYLEHNKEESKKTSSGRKAPHNNERKLVLTKKGRTYLETFRVKNAIILAAGFGSRCVPLTYETPKGLLEVHGKPMIERQIEQLIEKSITEIIIVVGYKKEQFDYLIDKYGVRLVYNPEYAIKNNLASLYRALQWLDSSYLLMSDYWIEENIFNTYEARSWYSCIYNDGPTNEWCVTTSTADKIGNITIGGRDAFAIVGPAYFSPSFSTQFKKYIIEYYDRPGTEDFYWEQVLKDHLDSLPIYMNRQTGNVHEIENLEELRQFDPSYNNASNNKILETISNVFNVPEEEIHDIIPIKKGMTNRSFTFSYDNRRYIMRIPGEGTDKLIDRNEESAVYQAINPLGICDDIVYFNAKHGYKISVFYDNARVCDPLDWTDVKMCIKKLREFHAMKISVDHMFDIFGQIEFYESLWPEPVSCFRDYKETKANVMSLEEYINSIEKQWTLTHIDAVPDNFLFVNAGGEEQIRMIDWEYSGMQDPHVDIAMFAIYSMYDKEQIDTLIDCYFDEKCPNEVRTKIYAYISACGLLWSNWCEYKSHLGVEFGEYALRQYRFAKEYYRFFGGNI